MKDDNVVHRALVLLDGLSWASREYKCSRWRVCSHLGRLYRYHDYRPRQAHHEGLSNPALGKDRLGAVISKHRLMALQDRLNPTSHICMTADKAVFYVHARALGLPVPRLYGVVDRPAGWTAEGIPLRGDGEWERFLSALEGEIIVKPAQGMYGRGIRAYRRVEGGFEDSQSSQVLTASSVAKSLLSDPARRLVVQQRLRNHPAIVELTGTDTLQTVRVRTLVAASGDVIVGSCFMKVAVGRQIRDNIEGGLTGNFLAALGHEDGRLRLPVAYKKTGRGVSPVPLHPESGSALEGFSVPWWKEAKALARKAAALFLPLRTVGWDIAVTCDGPVLVEGNRWWDPANLLAALPQEDTYPMEMASLLRAMEAEAAR